jgi:tryptophanyl-tRNA synthetase
MTASHRILSGIKPTGEMHIGNYFGAIQQQITLAHESDAYIMIADLHALNQVHDAAILRSNITSTLIAYIACGLDPEKVTLFQQSTVPAHAELTQILGAQVSLGLLERSHAYKDSIANGKPVNLGLFSYPVLMAADILLYQPEFVPVGNDQKQHVEIAVDLAQQFNHRYGEVFRIPKEYIPAEVGTIPGLDGRKMSKSYGNVLGLFEDPERIREKVMKITTDSRRPEEVKEPDTIVHLLSLVDAAAGDQLRSRYLAGGVGYREAKELLAEALIKKFAPLRERSLSLAEDHNYLARVLTKGAEKAAVVANETLHAAQRACGLR